MASEQLELVQPQNEQQQDEGYRMRNDIRKMCLNLKQRKSFEILKSTMNMFTCNTKLMFFMILSMIPLFSFMLFFEIKLHKIILTTPDFLQIRPLVTQVYIASTNKPRAISNYRYLDDYQLDFLSKLLYPLLKGFSMIITMKVAAKVHAGEKQATLNEVLCQNNNLNGLSVTSMCVQLLSNLTLLGLSWIVVNSGFLPNRSSFYLSSCEFDPVEFCFIVLHIAFYSALFVALLYKYLNWSVVWNMSMVISFLGEETGLKAFGMADYYGKHCKRTGLELMIFLYAFGTLLRSLCVFAGLCKASVTGVVFNIGLFCFGNLVKWVVFVLYFYDCKQQTLEKKADEEVPKVGNASDAS